MIVPWNNDYLVVQCPIRHWLTFKLKSCNRRHTSKTDRMRASKEGLHYRIWTYTYFVSIAAFQTSSSYVLGWGSPMTCNKKKYGLKEDKGEREDSGEKHALEKHAWKLFSGKDGKSRREATSKKSCNRAHVIKQENSNDLNMLLFQTLLQKPLSLLSFPLLLSFLSLLFLLLILILRRYPRVNFPFVISVMMKNASV